MGFDLAILGGWLYLLCRAWPASEWPVFVVKFLLNMVWALAIWMDIIEAKRARERRRMGTAETSSAALLTLASPTSAVATSDPATTGPATSGFVTSGPATSDHALELDDLGQHGRTIETQESAVGVTL
jgi:hypothetical protein